MQSEQRQLAMSREAMFACLAGTIQGLDLRRRIGAGSRVCRYLDHHQGYLLRLLGLKVPVKLPTKPEEFRQARHQA